MIILWVFAAAAALWGFVFFRLKGLFNPVYPDRSVRISVQAREVHSNLVVADLHADSLMYPDSLLRRGRQGHVDVPRLLEGQVGLQVFTCVSRFPLGGNIDHSAGRLDLVTPLAIAHAWPARTWGSLCERALYQASKLERFERQSQGRLQIIRSRADLRAWQSARAAGRTVVAALPGLEGGHCLEGRIENLDRLFAAGYRLMSPTHFFDNELGGSLHGAAKGGMTPFGRDVIARMLDLHMVIDLAHASQAMMADILALTDRPLILSHTGVKGICANNRNVSDEFMARIAATGGLIGIGFWAQATGGREVSAIARSIRYAADRIGVDHVALGSDFDGFVSAPIDCSQMIQVTQALLDEGFAPAEIEQIMGGNVIRVLAALLPE